MSAVIYLPCGKNTLVDEDVYQKIGYLAWHALPTNYVTVTLGPRNAKVRLYLHRYAVGALDQRQVDHLNKDRLDNRRENLRLCERWVNCHGAVHKKKHKVASIFTGVRRSNSKKKPWAAYITTLGKHHFLGHFGTEHEAAIAYDLRAIETYGIHAKTNLIPPAENFVSATVL